MNSKTTSFLTGASLGIALMYLLDPMHGKRRRARMRDRVTHLLRKTGDGLDATARDLSNRMTGAAAELQRWFDDVEPEERVLIERVHWSPTTRMVASVTGGALTAYGISRRNMTGTGAAVVGIGLVTRSVTNLETSRLVGIGAGRRAIDIQNTIDINAPIDRVFDFWNNYQAFPLYTRNVLEVHPTRINDQAHWIVRGLVGQKLDFDTLVTERVLNKIIAWKTVEGSIVGHAGIIRFEPMGEEATRVHVRMSYNPPGGALGHSLTRVAGADLKSKLEEDLARIKTTLETGRAPHDAAHSSGFERPNIQ